MAEMKFTVEQQKVIDIRNCNLLVSAAAGSGKTAVLVERIIKKLTKEHAEIDRMLIVTYTNAAAAEMRDRISAALEKCLLKEPENEHLQRQQLLLRSASIMTIHSFCLRLLREYFHVLGLDPGFRIADEAELTLLRSDVLTELLEKEYEQADTRFYRFVECYAGGKTDQALEEQIIRLYQFAESYPWPEEWLEKTEELLFVETGEAFEAHPCVRELLSMTKRLLSAALEDTNRALAVCAEPDGPAAYMDALLSDRELLENLLTADTYQQLFTTLSWLSFARLSSKKQVCAEEKKELVKQLRESNKKVVGRLSEDCFFQSTEEMLSDLRQIRETVSVLLRLTREFSENYRRAKKERNLLDFGDLEHLAATLLCEHTKEGSRPSAVAREVRTRFDEIMIDEYQDSNLIQELILSSISGEEEGRPNRFMVGDVKQSIYKFRMARPELFLEKYEDYRDEGSYVKIDLHKNFRSRAVVLEGINRVFEPAMRADFGGIEYDEAAALYPGASYTPDMPENRNELLLVTKSREGETDVRECEAYAVAARIKELVNGGLPLFVPERTLPDGTVTPAGTRKAEYKDIAVLFRAMSGWADVFLEVFAAEGIPCYADTQSGYFQTREVQLVLNLLRSLDNPRQDIPFAAVLYSELAGFTEEELARLRYENGRETEKETKKTYQKKLYDCVKEYETEGKEPCLREKCGRFLSWFEQERDRVAFLSVSELLEELYQLTGYLELVRVMPLGERRVRNLELLVAKAKQFEQSSYTGLFDFVRYIDRLLRYEVDFGEAAAQGEENAVRLMSIHKSKGLEFPVVFVAGMEKQFNQMDSRAKLVLHPELGIGADYLDPEKRVKSTGLFKKIIAKKLNEEMLAEELRVFYVALTRAREKLILTVGLKDEEEWEKLLAVQGSRYKELAGAGSYLDFLKLSLPSLLAEQKLIVRRMCEEEFVKKEAETLYDTGERRRYLENLDTGTEYHAALGAALADWESYSYPYAKEQGRKGKVSVSELKRAAYEEAEEGAEHPFSAEEEPVPTLPRYLQVETAVRGAELGTLYHRAFECMDFTKEYKTVSQVEEELALLIGRGRIREDARSLLRPEKLYRFFQSPIGQRMQRAAVLGSLKKEQPFVIGIPAGELDGSDSTECILVQGIIDACFEEEDGLVLVDYKTDFIPEHTKEELCRRYSAQLAYYARALRQITGKTVKECYLYSLFIDAGFLCEEQGENNPGQK